jgi:hypothetical protein
MCRTRLCPMTGFDGRLRHRDLLILITLSWARDEYQSLQALRSLGQPVFETHSCSYVRYLATIPSKLIVCTSLPIVLITTFVLWVHNRILPNFQKSNSESSLLEKQTPEKHLSYREFVTPPTVQRSTALIGLEIAIGYVLVPTGTGTGTFDLIV